MLGESRICSAFHRYGIERENVNLLIKTMSIFVSLIPFSFMYCTNENVCLYQRVTRHVFIIVNSSFT